MSRVNWKGLFLVVLCGPKVELSEMEMENTPEPHNFVTIHDWDFSMGGRIQIDNSSDQESTISGSPTENITGNHLFITQPFNMAHIIWLMAEVTGLL